MDKSTYLVILGLVSFGYLNNNLLPLDNNIPYVCTMGWSLFGFFYYKGYSPLYTLKNQLYVICFFMLLFLSQLTPTFNRFHQDFFSTVVANRFEYSFIFLLVLFKIGPTEEDIFRAFNILGIIALILAVIAFFFPVWFVDLHKLLGFLRNQGDLDFLAAAPGFPCAVFYFYILGYKVLIKYKQQKHLLVWFSLFMAYIFIVQNRSTLLIAVPSYLYVLLRSDFRIKWLILSILIIGCGSYLLFVFDALMEETRGQLNDTHYNRWQAIYYYVLERDYNFYNTLLGNGKPCAGSPYLYELVRVSKSRLAFVSDIGLIGTFYMYGLAMMLFIYRFVFVALLNKGFPTYLRFYALWVLIVPTIHCFGTGTECSAMLLFAIFFYCIILHEDNYGCICNHSELQHL